MRTYLRRFVAFLACTGICLVCKDENCYTCDTAIYKLYWIMTVNVFIENTRVITHKILYD